MTPIFTLAFLWISLSPSFPCSPTLRILVGGPLSAKTTFPAQGLPIALPFPSTIGNFLRSSTGFKVFFLCCVFGRSAYLRTTPPLWPTCGIRGGLLPLSSIPSLRRSYGIKGDSFHSPQFRRSGDPEALRIPSDSFSPSVHSGSSQCLGGLPQSSFAGPQVGVDLVFSSFQGPPSHVACDHRLVCGGSQPPSSCLLFPDGRSSVGGHGCDNAAVGWSSGLRLSSLRHSPACHREGLAVSGAGAHVGGSLLASAPVVSGSSGVSGGCSGVPSMSEGSTQTAPLPSFSPEPPCASSDCTSYIE